jgi:hypothetical protein
MGMMGGELTGKLFETLLEKSGKGKGSGKANTYTTEDVEKAQAGKTGMKAGGKVSSASSRADGCAVKGKTKGRMV